MAAPFQSSSVSKNPSLGLGLAVFLFTLLTFLPSLSGKFIWDDLQITADNYIHDSGNWFDVLTFRVLTRDVIDNNRPVMLASLMLDAALWHQNPFGFRLTNILLHAANAALLALLLRRGLVQVHQLREKSEPSIPPKTDFNELPSAFLLCGLPALLFAVHPVLTEAIGVSSFREDPLSTFGLLIALYLASGMNEFGPTSRKVAFFGSLCGVVIAIGTKESGIGATLVLTAWWFFFIYRALPSEKPAASSKIWLTLLACAWLVTTIFLVARFTLPPSQSQVFIFPPTRPTETLAGLLTFQPRLYVFYLQHVVLPSSASACYTPQSYAPINVAAGLIGTMAVAIVLIFFAWKHRLAAVGTVLIAAGLGVVSNIVPIYNPVADRYLYLPLAGAAVVLAAALQRWVRGPFAKKVACGALVVALLVLTVGSVKRQKIFHDDQSLWQDAAQKTPDGIQPFNFLGWAFYAKGDFTSAEENFQRALFNAHNAEPDSWSGLALACEAQGKTLEAEQCYRNAAALLPQFRQASSIKRTYFWKDEYLARLATIARRTGLWIEPSS